LESPDLSLISTSIVDSAAILSKMCRGPNAADSRFSHISAVFFASLHWLFRSYGEAARAYVSTWRLENSAEAIADDWERGSLTRLDHLAFWTQQPLN
jgi:hypothetical protein